MHRAVAEIPQRGLIEPRDTQPGLLPEGAGVRRHVARDDAQQRRLPRPVPPDQRDPLAGVDPQIRVLEQRQVTEGERSVL